MPTYSQFGRKLPVTLAALAALVSSPLIAQLAATQKKSGASAQVSASATVLQPLSISYPVNMTSGTVVGGTKSPGSITIPASYPGNGSPKPTYVNITASTAKTAIPPNAAQVTVKGTPNQAFTLRLTGWVSVSATSTIKSPSATTTGAIYYLGGSKSNLVSVASGQLDSKGLATVGIGSTITMTLAKGASGEIIYRPQVAVNYN